MKTKEEIKYIIDSVTETFSAKEMAMLHELPVSSLIEVFGKVNRVFIRPVGWYLLSENDKALKLIEWLKNRFGRRFEIEFIYGVSVEYTLKNWIIQGLNYENKRLG